MKQLINSILTLFVIVVLGACSYEPEPSKKPIDLQFSTDTLQFDTLFSERLSITKRLKIFNPSNEAVNISSIELKEQNASFQLLVNGVEGQSFHDQLLLANDSLLLLVSANIDQANQNNPFVIRDYLEVTNQNNEQSIVFEAWGQDAHYLSDTVLSSNTVWTAKKPYVLSGNVLVDSSAVLSVEPGTQIFSAAETFLIVNGSLQVAGTLDDAVVFTNDRLDEPFASSPGQWGGIVFLEGSENNYFKHTTIKNALFGLNLNVFNPDNVPDVRMENCLVGNMAISSIISLNSDFSAINSVFYNTASTTLSHTGGGSAYFTHCTIANYLNVSRDESSVLFSDFVLDNNEDEVIAEMDVQLLNSIIYGRKAEEIQFYEKQEGNLSLSFSNNLIRTGIELLSKNNSIVNQDPQFLEVNNGDFRLGEDSPAINSGLNTAIKYDILGNMRTEKPDLGAYQYKAEQTD